VHVHEGVAGVVLAAEKALLLEPAELTLDRTELLGELFLERLVVAGHPRDRSEVVQLGLERAERLELAPGATVLGRYLGRALLVVPEARPLHVGLEPADLLLQRRWVKGSPRAA
jgi:hypothetical protein